MSHETPKPAHIGHFFHLSIIRCPPKRTSPPLKERTFAFPCSYQSLYAFIGRFAFSFNAGISCAPRGEYLKRVPTAVIDCFIPDSEPAALPPIRNRVGNVDTRPAWYRWLYIYIYIYIYFADFSERKKMIASNAQGVCEKRKKMKRHWQNWSKDDNYTTPERRIETSSQGNVQRVAFASSSFLRRVNLSFVRKDACPWMEATKRFHHVRETLHCHHSYR